MYIGDISFDGLNEDQIKQGRVDLQGNLLVFDLTTESKAFLPGAVSYSGRLLGVAERQGNDSFVSPWIYLMAPDGTAKDEGARLSINVLIPDSTQIVISGEWEDFDGVKWPFSGRMDKCGERVPARPAH